MGNESGKEIKNLDEEIDCLGNINNKIKDTLNLEVQLSDLKTFDEEFEVINNEVKNITPTYKGDCGFHVNDPEGQKKFKQIFTKRFKFSCY
uniref:Uncharacterized protein n=1 Tax=Pithovirus LCPAC101 TaxID=2506586 RepID=A0A481Z2X5_9VIRU|nr:MAG: hypothetical protein LCPAC101_03710 [Pithovirus LCPAC101]